MKWLEILEVNPEQTEIRSWRQTTEEEYLDKIPTNYQVWVVPSQLRRTSFLSQDKTK